VDGGDRRAWLNTDRPGERVAVGEPLPGLRFLSVQSSDRCWSEYHLAFNLCLTSPSSKGLRASYRCRGTHEVGAGDLMAFEPGDHHVTTRINGGRADFDVLGMDPGEIERAMRELGLQGRFHFRSPQMRSAEVTGAFQRLMTSIAGGAETLELECHYAALLQVLMARCAESPRSLRRSDAIVHPGIRATRNYLRDNFLGKPSLEQLAQQAGLSRFAFAHAFKKQVGTSPHAYLQLRRACEARRLVEGGTPLPHVASALGYADVPFLTRTLKAYFGAPPARWRICFQSNR
jgi:AraC-like DNA-binding protein